MFFRTIAHSGGVVAHVQRRTFVSAVVLSRTWEKHTVADLKKEARARGLSSAGNKSTLVGRLQEHDKGLSSSAIASAEAVSVPSTSVLGDAPGVPPAREFRSPPPDGFMNLQLPDANYDLPPIPIQIPFVPDFWSSSTHSPPEAPVEAPKVVVVAGAVTHHGGGPTHSGTISPEELSTTVTTPTTSRVKGQGGFWDDAVESVRLPYPEDISATISKAWTAFKASLK